MIQKILSYGDDCTVLTDAYMCLGKKAGYMPLSNGSTYTMIAVCVVEGKVVVGAIGGATSRPNRPYAMKELMDEKLKKMTTDEIDEFSKYR